jgi:hypothetical protein
VVAVVLLQGPLEDQPQHLLPQELRLWLVVEVPEPQVIPAAAEMLLRPTSKKQPSMLALRVGMAGAGVAVAQVEALAERVAMAVKV